MSLLSEGLEDDDESVGDLPMMSVTTNAQAKNALGIALNHLASAYQKAKSLTNASNLRTSTIDMLDRNRKFAESTYRSIPLVDGPISDANLKKVRAALKNIDGNVREVGLTTTRMNQSIIQDGLDSIKQRLPSLPSPGGFFGTTLKIVGGVVVVAGVGYYLIRRAERKVIEHVTSE